MEMIFINYVDTQALDFKTFKLAKMKLELISNHRLDQRFS